MDMTYLFTAMGTAALGCLIFPVMLWCLTPERLPAYERFTRNRWTGLVGAWAALILCIPHAAVVSPGFLLPFLWPLALTVPVLCFFSLEYLTARALAGLVILSAYHVLHAGFQCHAWAAPVLSVGAWFFGFGGIWVSGKPCSLRDFFRWSARHRKAAAGIGAVVLGYGVLLVLSCFLTGNGGGVR